MPLKCSGDLKDNIYKYVTGKSLIDKNSIAKIAFLPRKSTLENPSYTTYINSNKKLCI